MNSCNISKVFGQRLRDLREERGLNQETVGEWFTMKKSTVSQWESGRLPHASIIAELAKKFNVTTDYLLGNSKEPASSNIDKQFELEDELTIAASGLQKEFKDLSPHNRKLVADFIKMLANQEKRPAD